MSPENRGYVPEKVTVKKETPVKWADKKEGYASNKSWGVATNQRLSMTGYWRK